MVAGGEGGGDKNELLENTLPKVSEARRQINSKSEI